MLHYTVYCTDRIGRVATPVFDLKLSELCFCWKFRLHGLSHGQPKPCLKPCLCSGISECKFCWTVALHSLLHGLPRPCPKPCGNLEKFGWFVCYTVDYTGYTNRVQSRVLALDGPNGLHGQTHGLHKPYSRPCLLLKFEYRSCLRLILWWEEFH